MKKFIPVFILLITLVAAFYFYVRSGQESKSVESADGAVTNVLNLAFVIDNEEYKLENGLAAKVATPESSFAMTLRVFGEPVYGDLDKDGDEDAAVWLQFEPGGSGTFYYGALAMKDGEGYKATDTLFLGDRIAPQTLSIMDGRAVYNFAERRADEPYSAEPSIGRSVYVHYDVESGEIGEWVKDFEGESNPTERYRGQVDRVSVAFENYNYTSYRLVTNGVVREGELNTERGYKEDVDATVYVLNWQKPEGEQVRYVRLTNEPGKLFLLNTEGDISGTPLNLE